jgi:hypothetical protein
MNREMRISEEDRWAIEQFLERARQDGLTDKMRSSAFVMAIGSDKPDLKLALKIGLCLLYEKPLVLILRHGITVPQRVRDLATEIIDLESGDVNSPVNEAKIIGTMNRMIARRK